MPTMDQIIVRANGTIAEHLRQRDWEAIAYNWNATGGMHGVPTIKPEWRETLVDEATQDGVDLLALVETVDQPSRSAGRPALHGERMSYHTIATTAEQWEHVQANGGAAYIRQLIDRARGVE